MPAQNDSKKIDGAKLMKQLVAGFITETTKRSGKNGFVLIGKERVGDKKRLRTLGMAHVRERDGRVKLEGARLDRSLLIEDDKTLAQARAALEAVHAENVKGKQQPTIPAQAATERANAKAVKDAEARQAKAAPKKAKAKA
jgi:hypothetical protein